MNQDNAYGAAAVDQAVAFVRSRLAGFVPRIGVVLGSGLGGFASALTERAAISYADIPGFPRSTVEGHSGRLLLAEHQGVPLVVMQGRVHLYEGYPAQAVVFPVRVLVRLGAQILIVTNAAGSVNPAYDEREVMLLTDHLNLTGTNALYGPNEATFGPRFPDMSEAYDRGLREKAKGVAGRLGLKVQEGVYAGLLGPSYETPAEIRMLGRLGADAVGMSTVNEVIAARHLGAKVLGISAISNKGAGLSKGPLSHDEVKAAGDAMQSSLTGLLLGTIEAVGA
ncbi:MAG: purine-nucleoside phosphorylase [Deltaproteobacteria bacterium]|jgi:purine-nucleoside phosphorylase|nr:purine-nucleoside phosphorylase [Deltaproteobacteria bacterium]